MKEKELRDTAICLRCRQPHGHAGWIFHRVRVRTYGIDLRAVQRQDGLTAMLGGHAGLAQIMGPDQEMAKVLQEREFTVCAHCFGLAAHLDLLLERASDDGAKQEVAP